MKSVRVILLEADTGVGGWIARAFSTDGRAVVVAQAHTADQVAPLLRHNAIDLVVIGVGVSEPDRTDAIRQVRALRPEARIIVRDASGAGDSRIRLAVTRQGSASSVRATPQPERRPVSNTTHSGRSASPAAVPDATLPHNDGKGLLRQIAAWFPYGSDSARAEEPLTACEREVAGLAAQGLTTREIAKVRHRSVETIRTKLKSAMRKLGIHSHVELARHWSEYENPPQIHPNG